jgi:hypothetical protein
VRSPSFFYFAWGCSLENRWVAAKKSAGGVGFAISWRCAAVRRRDFVAVSALIRQSISGMLPPRNQGPHAMSQTNSSGGRRIVWQSVITVLSAAVLISAEVFGAAFAGGWALANLMGFGDIGVYVFQVIFFVGGVAVMIAFVRNGMRVEPFTAPE